MGIRQEVRGIWLGGSEGSGEQGAFTFGLYISAGLEVKYVCDLTW